MSAKAPIMAKPTTTRVRNLLSGEAAGAGLLVSAARRGCWSPAAFSGVERRLRSDAGAAEEVGEEEAAMVAIAAAADDEEAKCAARRLMMLLLEARE